MSKDARYYAQVRQGIGWKIYRSYRDAGETPAAALEHKRRMMAVASGELARTRFDLPERHATLKLAIYNPIEGNGFDLHFIIEGDGGIGTKVESEPHISLHTDDAAIAASFRDGWNHAIDYVSKALSAGTQVDVVQEKN